MMGITTDKSITPKLSMKAIKRMFELLEGVNRDIEASIRVNSPLMVRQYEHLKRQYTKDLLALLANYDLPITLTEPAKQAEELPQPQVA